jgi:glucose/arabinose dehydrogenase
MRRTLFALALLTTAVFADEEDYYRIVTLDAPADLKLEVSGIAPLPDGRVAVSIRKGEVWIIDGALGDAPRYSRFASGLHEPLGLAYRDGAFYVVQRSEVTKLRDTDGDGRADEYLTFAKGWGVTGNYHEYAYGPVFDRDGNLWVTLNATLGKKLVPDDAWRGWSLKVHPDATWEPVSGGFRSPSGLGLNTAGDLFVTDQQGNWFGTGPLLHVEPGVFHGHADALASCKLPGATFRIDGDIPENLTVAEAAQQVPHYRLPAVWFPYRKMGMSCTGVLCDTTGGKFGPFDGQLFVGDFTMSLLTRVFLEKVNGRYQGACFPFRKDLQCAVLRMAWGADGSMFVGETNRGWNSLGTRAYGLQRLIWTGQAPFEVKAMEAQPDGFRLTFTQPIDPATLRTADAAKLSSYTYQYHSSYGSDEIDPRDLAIRSIEVAPDALSARLVVEGLRAGYVHELHLPGVRSAKGAPLLHDAAYYTLNAIP